MKPPLPLPIGDLVLLQEMCLERELRCEQRAAEAAERGDWAQADYERRLKDRFSLIKNRFWHHLQGRDHESLAQH
jgi:hypothetical protein